MPQISEKNDVCTVMVRLSFDSKDGLPITDLAKETMGIFARQPGFVSASMHKSADGAEIVQYLQWRSQADHEACMGSPDFHEGPAQQFMELVQSGKVRLDVKVYNVVQVLEGA